MEEELIEIKPRGERMMKSAAARKRRKAVKNIRQTKLDREDRELYEEFDRMIRLWGKKLESN
jgi:hypothetical protein